MGLFGKANPEGAGGSVMTVPYTVEIERLLLDISPDAPSGEVDLSGDPAFIDLEIKIQGTPEREFGGKIVQEAKPPNWPKVQRAAFSLLTRAHDLRVVMFLLRAMLHTEGIAGLYTGLELLNGLMEDYWETLYPQLDPADNNDPTERINILWALSEDPDIMTPLHNAALFSPQPAIRVSLRDLQIAGGKISVKEEEKGAALSLPMIEQAFEDCDRAAVELSRETIHQSIASLEHLEVLIEERVGAGQAPDYKRLKSVLEEMAAFFDQHLPQPAPPPASEPSANLPTDAAADADPPALAPASPTKADRSMETISSRQDVIHLLDRICAYYDQHEPASPVPLLLKRARQLVEKNFVEIVEDLAPQAAEQIKTLFGDYPDSAS